MRLYLLFQVATEVAGRDQVKRYFFIAGHDLKRAMIVPPEQPGSETALGAQTADGREQGLATGDLFPQLLDRQLSFSIFRFFFRQPNQINRMIIVA